MKKLLFVSLAVSSLFVFSCHKKNYPAGTESSSSSSTVNTSTAGRADTQAVAKVVVTRKPRVGVAKMISVNDNAAKKSVDGRLYYDVGGNRYWKNYKDGKYYLFDKSMYNDPAFIPPK